MHDLDPYTLLGILTVSICVVLNTFRISNVCTGPDRTLEYLTYHVSFVIFQQSGHPFPSYPALGPFGFC